MRDHLLAVLINRHPETFASLQQALRHLSVQTFNVETYRQAEDHLIPPCRPHLVFADVSLWDGSWVYILNLAEKADPPLSVIVVGIIPETQDYLAAKDRGAFDFVAPPFELALLDFVVRAAATDARSRRETWAPVAVA